MPDPVKPVLSVEGLQTVFNTRKGEVHAVNHVDFDLRAGELLGVVGESGSGKSVTMMSLLKLLPMPPAEVRNGRAIFDGRDLLQLTDEELRTVRGGEIGFVFQDPMTSLNPSSPWASRLWSRYEPTWACPSETRRNAHKNC